MINVCHSPHRLFFIYFHNNDYSNVERGRLFISLNLIGMHINSSFYIFRLPINESNRIASSREHTFTHQMIFLLPEWGVPFNVKGFLFLFSFQFWMKIKNIKFDIHIHFNKYNNWLNIVWNFIIYHNVRSIKLLIRNIYFIKLYKNIIKKVISIQFIKFICFFRFIHWKVTTHYFR